jgi:hypothetical protein
MTTARVGAPRSATGFRRWCVVSLFGLVLSTRVANAALWDNPSFRSMTADAELIVLAEIVESGQMYGRARVLEAFKGDAPESDLVVTGYNNSCWTKSERERESLKAREQYLFFLRPVKGELSHDLGAFPPANCAGESAVPKAWRSLPKFTVPNPSMGDYRIDHDAVRCDWRFCSDCSDRLAVSTRTAFAVLRASIQPNEPARLSSGRSVLGRELSPELVDYARSDERARVRLAWLLEGQAVFGENSARDILVAAAASDQPDIRVAAVRALPSLGATGEVMQLIGALLRSQNVPDANSLQVEAVRALMVLDPQGQQATDMILAAIPTSDPGDSVRRDMMDPAADDWVSGRRLMVASLTQYRAARAASALLAILRREDNSTGSLDALMTYFSVFPSAPARAELLRQYAAAPDSQVERYNRYFIDDGDPTALNLVFERMLRPTSKPHETRAMFRYFALHRPEGDPRLERAVRQFLRERVDDNQLAELVPAALVLSSDRVVEELLHLDSSRLSDSSTKTQERVARGLQLKRSPPLDPETRIRAWIQLLLDDRWSGYATAYFLRELACTTPADWRPTLTRLLKREELPELAERANQALDYDKTAVALRQIPDFVCASRGVAAEMPAVASATGPNLNVPTPVRGGCSAGCATSSGGRGALQLVSLALLGLVSRWRRARLRGAFTLKKSRASQVGATEVLLRHLPESSGAHDGS